MLFPGDLRDVEFDVIDYVVSYVAEHERIPSMAKIAAAMGITRQGVQKRYDAMARKGLMPVKPLYAPLWFALTAAGEAAYLDGVRRMRRS